MGIATANGSFWEGGTFFYEGTSGKEGTIFYAPRNDVESAWQ
jgi:hypothetical protein